MEEIGHTTPDSTTVRSICYAEEGTKLCTANNETLRLWNWDPNVTLLHNYNIGWDRIQDMKICNHNPSEHLIGISSNSNFVSIWDVDIGHLHEQSLSSVEVSEDRGIPVAPVLGSVRERSQGNRKSTNHSTPVSNRTGTESDDDNDSYGSGRNVREKPPLKVDGYFSSPDRVAPLETVPEVLWEGGHSANDLATSISESKYRHDHDNDRGGGSRANPPNVTKQEEERAIHDRFIPSSNPRYPQGRRPVTREKERDSGAKKGEKAKFEVAPANTPEIGLAVVGRPMTSSENRERNDETPPKQPPSALAPSRYVVNSESRKAPSDLDRVEQGQERDSRAIQQRGSDQNVRRVHSESNMPNNSSNNPSVRVGLKRDSSLQSIITQQPVGSVPIPSSDPAAKDLLTHQEIDTFLTLVITQSDLTATILQQRYEILRQLQSYWRNGEISAISETLLPLLNSFPQPSDAFSSSTVISINSTPTLSLLLVFSDFMNSIDFHSPTVTLSTCPIFLSLFHQYLKELCRPSSPPLPPVMISILQSTQTLYQIFRQIIHETRVIGSVSHGNIDMAREERLEKCNLCYRHFLQIRESADLLREKYRKNRDLIERFQRGLSDLED